MRRLLPVALLLPLSLSACMTWQKIPPGTVSLSNKAELVTSQTWNSQGDAEKFLWTQDGPELDSMLFHLAIKDGKTIFADQDSEARQSIFLKLLDYTPDQISFRFSKTMTELEIVELFASSWGKAAGDVPVKVESVAPANLDGHPGIRFQYSFIGRQDELLRRGLGVAAVVDEKLYVVHYLGSAIYHFERGRPEAERMIASFKIKKG